MAKIFFNATSLSEFSGVPSFSTKRKVISAGNASEPASVTATAAAWEVGGGGVGGREEEEEAAAAAALPPLWGW